MAENLPDETIMTEIKNGNLAQMSVLFERYNVRLFNFFLRMGLDRDISQDLTQNLFYRMIKYRQSYKAGNPVKSWIFQIARNLHTDYRNQQKKNDDLFSQAEDYPADVPEEPENYPEEDYDKLDRALSELGNAQREIIVLSRFQGLKYSEIAAITGQSVTAIKVATFRAIRQLRIIYAKQV
jgi:RNA polymerase sigma factor (sigma-70 family)